MTSKSLIAQVLKQPGAPALPRSAFSYFAKDKRDVVANTDIKSVQVMPQLAQMWRSASPKDRLQYDELAREDASRYKLELHRFLNLKGIAPPKCTIKPIVRASQLFMCERRVELMGKVKPNELHQRLREDWLKLTHAARRMYQACVEGKSLHMNINKATSRPLYPTWKPRTPFLAFYTNRRDMVYAENPGLDSKQTAAILSNEWLTMSPEKRKVYEDHSQQDLEAFERQVKLFLNWKAGVGKAKIKGKRWCGIRGEWLDLSEQRRKEEAERITKEEQKRREKAEKIAKREQEKIKAKQLRPLLVANTSKKKQKARPIAKPCHPFTIFAMELRQPFIECSVKWKALTDVQRQLYVEKAKADVERYKKDCTAAGLRPEPYYIPKRYRILKSNAPTKKPRISRPNFFLQFCNHYLKDLKLHHLERVMKLRELGQQWRAMTVEERREWAEKHGRKTVINGRA